MTADDLRTRDGDHCRAIDVDGEMIRVRGEAEPTDTERAMIADIIRAARAHLAELERRNAPPSEPAP